LLYQAEFENEVKYRGKLFETTTDIIYKKYAGDVFDTNNIKLNSNGYYTKLVICSEKIKSVSLKKNNFGILDDIPSSMLSENDEQIEIKLVVNDDGLFSGMKIDEDNELDLSVNNDANWMVIYGIKRTELILD